MASYTAQSPWPEVSKSDVDATHQGSQQTITGQILRTSSLIQFIHCCSAKPLPLTGPNIVIKIYVMPGAIHRMYVYMYSTQVPRRVEINVHLWTTKHICNRSAYRCFMLTWFAKLKCIHVYQVCACSCWKASTSQVVLCNSVPLHVQHKHDCPQKVQDLWHQLWMCECGPDLCCCISSGRFSHFVKLLDDFTQFVKDVTIELAAHCDHVREFIWLYNADLYAVACMSLHQIGNPRLMTMVAENVKAKVHDSSIDISISWAAMTLLAVAVALVLVRWWTPSHCHMVLPWHSRGA